MKIVMVTPAPPGSLKGNRVTAQRWADLLKGLGHRVTVATDWAGEACDVLVALHAKKSHPAARAYRRAHPAGPLVVALTGTDVYRDLRHSRRAHQSLAWADRLVTLQPLALDELPPAVRPKARVIIQSSLPVDPRPARPADTFQMALLGHLRHEKDPLRAALALRRLPADSPCRVVQAGQALTPGYDRQARAAMARDPRYRWVGEIPRPRARRLLAASHAMIISSRMEGGANVVSEALINDVPVLASDIPGNVGLLGADYPGYYPVGDSAGLAALMARASSEPAFYRQLAAACRRLKPRFRPAQEQDGWRRLLREVVPAG